MNISSSGTDVVKLIVDTDCGVDDALALLLVLNSGRSEVLGITCCHGNTSLDNAFENVHRVLHFMNREDIPIYKGSQVPLVSKPKKRDTAYHCDDGFGNCSSLYPTGKLQEPQLPAVFALLELTKKFPHQITLLALGPLTNLALAHRIDPEFSSRLKSIVCMGGNYRGIGNVTETAEFNFYQDPEAAKIMMSEVSCPLLLVTWETCQDFGMKWATYDSLLKVDTPKGKLYQCITKMMAKRARDKYRDYCTDCDLLAAVVALYPECVLSVVERHLSVECVGTLTRGLAVVLDELKTDVVPGMSKIKIVTGLDDKLLNELRFLMLQDEFIP